MMRTSSILSAVALLLAAGTASAQQNLNLPQASPAAEVSQTVGLSEIKVVYHRPAMNKRVIWGELVPYDQVWRAGANENTTVTFSSPVKVMGKELAAGTYGLHMIPTPKDWTVIFSKMNVAWGSFSYDEKEDALRVKVTPQPTARPYERLAYEFDDPTDSQVTLALRWEKLEVPIKIEIDTPEVVRASIREQLRGLPRFSWQGWNQAARYWLQSGGDLGEAAGFADKAVASTANYQTLTTQALVLEKKGDAKGAAAARARAQGAATENDINLEGYALVGQKKIDEAIAVFQKNVKSYPSSWNAHDSLAEAYLTKGDKKNATAEYGKALSLVKDETQKKRIEGTLARLKGK